MGVSRPEDLVRRTLRAFQDRFPLVIEDLLDLPREPMIIAEGFGFTPEIISPMLSSKRQAIWLVPTDSFKWTSMEKRDKFTRRQTMSDPERAVNNLLRRDKLLAEHMLEQAQSHGFTVYKIDGSRSAEEMTTLVERHFRPFLLSNKR